jgi:site-specific recombinase XerD
MLQVVDPALPAQALELEELVRRFRNEQGEVELSPDTIRTYESPLRQFTRWMAGHGVTRTDQLTRELLSAWQDSLKHRVVDPKPNAKGELKPTTRSIYSIAVRQLVTFAAGLELVDLRLALAIRRVKVYRGLPRPIPPADLTRIAVYLDRRCQYGQLIWLRTRALFWYLVCSSARISEALQMERPEAAHLVSAESGATYVTRKGGHEGLLLCPPAAVAMIREYLEARHDTSPWLWISHLTGGWCYVSGKPPALLTIQGANEKWRRVAESAHVKTFTSHQCRHTTATELLAAGIPQMVIVEHMGHADSRQLTTYAQVDRNLRQGAVNAMEKLVKQHRPKSTPKLVALPTPAPERPARVVSDAPAEPPTGSRPLTDEEPWSDIAGSL